MPSGDVLTELMAALRGHEEASTVWAQLTDDQRGTYLDWIGKAKTPARRDERVTHG